MPNSKKAVSVLIGAVGINLILGISYVWSIISKDLIRDYHWTSVDVSWPYTLSLVLATAMAVPGGWLGELFGPKFCTLIGGTLIGGGLFLSGFATTPSAMIVTYGLMVGTGFGFCTSVTTATAIKWFPFNRKGMVSGICMAGMGFSAVYISPVVHALLAAYDIKRTFQFVGCGAFAVVIFFTLFLSRPESLHQSSPAAAPKTVARNLQGHDLAWRDMIKTTTFYKYWIMFTFAASGGVMIFGNLANIAIKQAQWENGYLLVILMASFNTLGRLSSGAISDRIGVKNTLRIVFILQMVNMILFNNYRTSAVLVVGTAFLGFCYGGLIAMFPASIAGEFGIRNLGTNYALLNTAYGVAAFVGPMMAGKIVDATGSYHLAFIGSAVLLLLATIISFTLKARHQK